MNKILIFLFLFLSIPIFSQVVNIEKQRTRCDSNGFYGAVDLTTKTTKDKLSKFEGAIGLNFSYKKNKSIFLNIVTYGTGKIENTNYENNFFLHSRYNYNFRKRIIGEIFFQNMMNDLLNVDSRTLMGAGLRIGLINKDNFLLHTGLIHMYEYEILIDKNIEKSFRSSDYISLVYNISDNIKLLSAIYYQPKYSNFKDYRIFTSISLDMQITKLIHFEIDFNTTYDTYPAPEIDNFVYNQENKLSFRF